MQIVTAFPTVHRRYFRLGTPEARPVHRLNDMRVVCGIVVSVILSSSLLANVRVIIEARVGRTVGGVKRSAIRRT